MENEIMLEADSLEEVREMAKSQLPRGFKEVSEKILQYDYKIIEGTGRTVEEVFAALEKRVPPGATITRHTNVTDPDQRTIDLNVDLHDDALAARRAGKFTTGSDQIVSEVQLLKKGSQGFLGMGKKPWQYRATILQYAKVSLSYKQKVKAIFTFAPKTLFDALIDGAATGEIKAFLESGISIEARKDDSPWKSIHP